MKRSSSKENAAKTDLISSEREFLTHTEPKSTTSNLLIEKLTTSKMVTFKRDIVSVLEVGLSLRMVHSKAGERLKRWKSDGEEYITRTGPTAPMWLNSMPTATLISTKCS
jgi:hypothetical protein